MEAVLLNPVIEKRIIHQQMSAVSFMQFLLNILCGNSFGGKLLNDFDTERNVRLGPNLAHKDRGTIKRKLNLIKCGTFQETIWTALRPSMTPMLAKTTLVLIPSGNC